MESITIIINVLTDGSKTFDLKIADFAGDSIEINTSYTDLSEAEKMAFKLADISEAATGVRAHILFTSFE